jgi:phosphosulfolactate synthase
MKLRAEPNSGHARTTGLVCDHMSVNYLELPYRIAKPRSTGITMVIDNGMPLQYFTDLVSSAADYVDFIKFGWGTSVVHTQTEEKIAVLRDAGVEFYFGGTLFEKYMLQDRFEQFRAMCQHYGSHYVEVSNGSIEMSDTQKSAYVAKLSDDFHVISEVGSKDSVKSENMAPNKWISSIRDDLSAGAELVTLETRESGHGGICRPNGELRFGLIEEIVTSGLGVEQLLFEAPTMELQSYFVKRVGSNVNLGNIAATDIIGLETIRLGLRSETLHSFEPREDADLDGLR